MAIPRRWRPSNTAVRVSLVPPTSLFQITEQNAVPAAAFPKQAVQLVDCLRSTLASAVVPMEMDMWMLLRPSPNEPRKIDALSPPRDTSATDAVTEQRIRQFQDETLRNEVQEFSTNHQFCSRIPLFFTPSDQPRPVVEVAKELVGLFLICRESNVVMRIVETEAYKEDEEIFSYRFSQARPDFRGPAGRLVSYTTRYGQQFMFITAGDDDSEDVVLLRTCSAVHGYREISNRVELTLPANYFQLLNMITGPTKVHMALAPELESYCNLLIPSTGLYLVQKDPGNPLIMMDGPRILPDDTPYIIYSGMRGFGSRFRFSFVDCAQTLKLKSKLHRVEKQPHVERSTEHRLPASDGNIR